MKSMIIEVDIQHANQILENWAKDGFEPVSIAYKYGFMGVIAILLKQTSFVTEFIKLKEGNKNE